MVLLGVLLAGIALALFGRRMPVAAGADAPAELFSAARARQVLDRIARLPHPVGSGEHECVHEHLVEALQAMGLECEQQAGRLNGVPLTNLLARVPGHASTGTVLCAAHYDSVPSGPGAGDDGVGVVAWLEALRALLARGWQPRNDVLLLLSDGEELGLLGARLFAAMHPAVGDVEVVINLEAIGNGGPAILFELGQRNGARVRCFARAVRSPTGTSLGDAVYRRMPNDTDLTVFLRRGIGGFNIALAGGSSAYHAPHDTPANLDPRSLQHMGECALELLEHTSALDLERELDGADVTFFDLLGRALVVHPRLLDSVPVAFGVALVLLARRRARLGWGGLGWLAGRHALECGAKAVCLAGGCWLLDALGRLFTPRFEWIPGNTTSGGLLFAGLTLTITAFETLRTDGSGEPAVRRAFGALSAWSLAAPVALLALPGASFALAWPLVLAALGLLALQARNRLLAAVVLVSGLAATLLLVLPILHQLVQLFQRRPTTVVLASGLVLTSGAGLFTPHLDTLRRGARWAGPLLLALGLVALLASVIVARGLGWRQGSFLP